MLWKYKQAGSVSKKQINYQSQPEQLQNNNLKDISRCKKKPFWHNNCAIIMVVYYNTPL